MKYDVIICGSGIAGLWLLNTLTKHGFNVLLIEKNTIGGVQTLASQGMIHGGQKYLLQGHATAQARSIAQMPERWLTSFEGTGDIDLRDVRSLSQTQVMWPAGSIFSEVGLVAAAKLVNAKTRKLENADIPDALHAVRNTKPDVYELPERVLDTRSLVSVLARPEMNRIKKGTVTELRRDGSLVVDGLELRAKLIIFAAGLGNEEALRMLDAPAGSSQRRPLRQILIKTMEHPLYGHGVVNNPKPRVTVTSHPLTGGGYVWYLGGGIAEHTVSLSDEDAIAYTKKEMQDIFPKIDWNGKQWATWLGVRAEASNQEGMLGDGPVIQEYGNVLVVWPTKLTFVPMLSDNVLTLLDERNMTPEYKDVPPPLPTPDIGEFPWESARWE